MSIRTSSQSLDILWIPYRLLLIPYTLLFEIQFPVERKLELQLKLKLNSNLNSDRKEKLKVKRSESRKKMRINYESELKLKLMLMLVFTWGSMREWDNWIFTAIWRTKTLVSQTFALIPCRPNSALPDKMNWNLGRILFNPFHVPYKRYVYCISVQIKVIDSIYAIKNGYK